MGALVSAPMLFGASAASAAPGPSQQYKCTSTPGAIACYEDDGDFISASDTSRDGFHVETVWAVGNHAEACRNFDGYGVRKTCNEDFPEHTVVCFTAIVVNGRTLMGRSDTKCLPTTDPN